jgi:hypothetical protein
LPPKPLHAPAFNSAIEWLEAASPKGVIFVYRSIFLILPQKKRKKARGAILLRGGPLTRTYSSEFGESSTWTNAGSTRSSVKLGSSGQMQQPHLPPKPLHLSILILPLQAAPYIHGMADFILSIYTFGHTTEDQKRV